MGYPAPQHRRPGRAYFSPREAARREAVTQSRWAGDRRREAEVTGRESPTGSARGQGPALSVVQNPAVNWLWPLLRFSGETSMQRIPHPLTHPCPVSPGSANPDTQSPFLLTVEGFRRALSRHRSPVPGRTTAAGSCFPFQFRGQRLRSESLTFHLPSSGPAPPTSRLFSKAPPTEPRPT